MPPLPQIRPRNEAGEELTDEEMHGESMVRPRLIAGDEAPTLTEEQIRARRNVLLVARCKIHIDGTISDCTMLCSDPLFDETVLANVKARRYSPVLFRGRPVEVTYTFTFRIHGA